MAWVLPLWVWGGEGIAEDGAAGEDASHVMANELNFMAGVLGFRMVLVWFWSRKD